MMMLASVCGQAVWAENGMFVEQIAPIFQRRCLSCHDDATKKGDFSLQSAAGVLMQIEIGNAGASHLVELLTPVDGAAEMPQDGPPLSDEEISQIRTWIDAGADWPAELQLTRPTADLDWWSLKPLLRPEVPAPHGAPAQRVRTPIDAFVVAKHEELGLELAPEADRLTLIRRLSFDLLGLPPTPEQVARFVHDPDPLAYEHLVETLLASKHYGERWARHWLDVVHYADTHGYDKDKLRPNAWPYRDYVIRSLNADKPYSQFVLEQLAGDVLWPGTRDGVTATGFIAAGPWDFIGHAEVPESKIDGRIARHLDRDDMVASTMNTFVSTTVQCARCHDHKFDLVSQEHYYSMQAVFAALDRADRPYDMDANVAQTRAALTARQQQLQGESERFTQQIRHQAGADLVAVEEILRELEVEQSQVKERPEFGYHSQIEATPDHVKWFQIDLGQPTAIEKLVYVGAHDMTANIGHGFGFPPRFKIELSNDATFETGVVPWIDHTSTDVEHPGTEPQVVERDATVVARYVRMTATKLALRDKDYIFAMGEFQVWSNGQNVALEKPVTALDSIEAPTRWQRQNLVDDYYYGRGAKPELLARISHARSRRDNLLQQATSDTLAQQIAANAAQSKRVHESMAELPPQQVVYAGTIHHGNGAFEGTGATGGKPRVIHVLHRGNILEPRALVGPGTIPIMPNSDWKFAISDEQPEGERRVALARWIVQEQNPLTWRSIVNRIWLYHFGRGLVDSPNDFGRMGQLPSHPELLDWLAVEFRDGGQSWKNLHRLIVTSSVYRQTSDHHAEHRQIDSENVYLWRMNRRRLTAEEIRDAVLAVSGKLDQTMYGPGMQLFVLERPEHSPHYEYDKHDPDDPASHRRAVYRFIVRSQPDPFMSTLDCADSSQSVAKRDETVTALQALSLLNNKFMLRMSKHFAELVRGEMTTVSARVERAYSRATGHAPSPNQLTDLMESTESLGLENTCRLLLNLNEFVFVD